MRGSFFLCMIGSMSGDEKIDVRALANMVRMEVSDAELAKLEREIPAILAFVDTIQSADTSGVTEDTSLRNVTRLDEDPHESGLYTEDLLAAAPGREGNRIAVKQVLTRKGKQ